MKISTKVFAVLLIFLLSTTTEFAQWTRQKAIEGGFIRAMAMNGNYLFAGSDGGVFLSTDNGTSWIETSNGITNTNIQALAIKNDTLFAGTKGAGVFRSIDNGTSWTSTTLNNTYLNTLLIKDQSLFAGTSTGLYLSTDNGDSWNPVNNGLADTNIMALAYIGDNIFAGSQSGVSLSTNGGTIWATVNSGLADTSVSSGDDLLLPFLRRIMELNGQLPVLFLLSFIQ